MFKIIKMALNACPDVTFYVFISRRILRINWLRNLREVL